MTTAQVVEMSVTVNNNSPIQDFVHPDDQTQPFENNKVARLTPIPRWLDTVFQGKYIIGRHMGQYCNILTAQNILNDKIKVVFCIMTFLY